MLRSCWKQSSFYRQIKFIVKQIVSLSRNVQALKSDKNAFIDLTNISFKNIHRIYFVNIVMDCIIYSSEYLCMFWIIFQSSFNNICCYDSFMQLAGWSVFWKKYFLQFICTFPKKVVSYLQFLRQLLFYSTNVFIFCAFFTFGKLIARGKTPTPE